MYINSGYTLFMLDCFDSEKISCKNVMVQRSLRHVGGPMNVIDFQI